ncbi:MAG: response regulator transcription factor [candidate division WS1 bacterium]|jgi:DNA-binding response OmpR family regulator|nr:response regulator transcription factor [candidate division WS1 bacterium]
MATILIADDDSRITSALAALLSEDGHVTICASDGNEALRMIRSRKPDLAVIDIVMPALDGLGVVRQLRQDPALATMPIILLTGRHEPEERVRGLDEGADDYISKPFDTGELRARVRAVLRRAGRFSETAVTPQSQPSQINCGPISMDLPRRQVRVDDALVTLTPTEFQLLQHLMTHSEQVFSSQELLQTVWDYPAGTGDSSLVRWHMRNLRAKLEPVPEEPVFILTVGNHGYMLTAGDNRHR